MLCWGGFSARALATKQSSLARMRGDGARGLTLDPRVTMTEATAEGVAPAVPGAKALRVRRACR